MNQIVSFLAQHTVFGSKSRTKSDVDLLGFLNNMRSIATKCLNKSISVILSRMLPTDEKRTNSQSIARFF